ncbi:MAG: hypothetical protein QOJ09_131 [Actinomycetota bacterium]|jgi:hypothetical protein|nr:hypothetical protein [Actinomycetota bacterium]
MRVHIWPSPYWVDDAGYAAIVEVAGTAEAEVREHLPTLEADLYLLVNQTDQVSPETGDGGFTIGPHCIRWDVDPHRDVQRVARTSLRGTLFHECHHAVRLQRRPEEAGLVDWPSVAIFEGLASVFEDLAGQARAPWRTYDRLVIDQWTAELFAQPMDEGWRRWKFDHPDGRRNIAYKVGAWIADEAVRRSGRSAADLVWESPEAIIALAACLPS